jgi:hypothetical protein
MDVLTPVSPFLIPRSHHPSLIFVKAWGLTISVNNAMVMLTKANMQQQTWLETLKFGHFRA